MVKSRRILPALGAMLRAPWLLFNFLTTLALLSSEISADSRIKISDVAGDEGAIDGLEALLDRRLPGSEKIQFGVGPSDRRYFDQLPSDVKLQLPSDVRPNALQTRSQGFDLGRQDPNVYGGSHPVGQQNPSFYGGSPDIGNQNPNFYGEPQGGLSRSDMLRVRGGYGNSGVLDPNQGFANLQFTGANQPVLDSNQGFANLQFAGADQRLGVADPQQIDAYDQFLGDLSDQYDSAFTDLVASRLAGYEQEDPRSQAFLARLREVLRSGDRGTAERMLGVQGGQNALRGIKATSQPEFVHFNHQQQPHNRQVQPLSSDSTSKIQLLSSDSTSKIQPLSSDSTSKIEPVTSDDPKGDYNPNDPSSSVKTEPKTNHSETALGGTQLAGLPQHLGQSQHSAYASQAVVQNTGDEGGFSDVYFTAMVAGCTAAAVCFIIGTGVCWYRLNKNQRAAKDTEYPAYGVTGPSRELSPGAGPGGDRNLAHSAHMYHYQQQKNQMIALDKSGGGDGPAGGGTASDVDSEEEDDGEERDYTVYECPGLAPMGEMVVPNPMYPPEDVTPASPSLKEELPGRAGRD